jgi:hypothetical protein
MGVLLEPQYKHFLASPLAVIDVLLQRGLIAGNGGEVISFGLVLSILLLVFDFKY